MKTLSKFVSLGLKCLTSDKYNPSKQAYIISLGWYITISGLKTNAAVNIWHLYSAFLALVWSYILKKYKNFHLMEYVINYMFW